MFDIEAAKVNNIKSIAKYCEDNNTMMLSNYSSDFWYDYRTNYRYFDRLFKRRYSSFFPYGQDPGEEVGQTAITFIMDVSAWLRANDKRYSELYRINSIEDNDAYSLVNNVDYTETYTGEESGAREFVKGEQSDSSTGSTSIGAHSDTSTDSKQYGAQTITEDKDIDIGEREDEYTKSITHGAQSNSGSENFTKGAQENTLDRRVSAFNETTVQPESLDSSSEGVRTDTKTTSESLGSHTDTEEGGSTTGSQSNQEYTTSTIAAHTDTGSFNTSYGARSDSTTGSSTFGERTDTDAHDLTQSHELHRVGNMGVQTVDDMLKKHWDNWDMFNFYDMIFSEIANELLRGC